MEGLNWYNDKMNDFEKLYGELRGQYGRPEGQWKLWCKRPKTKKEREEVIIGAILTQRTNWKNVDLAINNLKKARVNSLESILRLGKNKLAPLIKPSGFYRTKADYLFNLAGQTSHMDSMEDPETDMEINCRAQLSILKSCQKYNPDVKIVVQQSHDNWSSQEAMVTVENALTKHKNKIDAILANNSGMAHGAVQALKEQNLLGKVFVAGADADLSAIKNIVAGHQQFEVLKAIQPLAESAAEVAVKLAKNESPKNDAVVFNGKAQVKTVNTPVYPVTRDNLKTQIIDTGFHSAKDVYGKE